MNIKKIVYDKYENDYGFIEGKIKDHFHEIITNIDNQIIDFAYDSNSLKQGKYLPGYGIEIIGTDQAVERLKNTTNACIIFAWNVAEDIKKNILSSDLDPDIIVIPLPKLEIS